MIMRLMRFNMKATFSPRKKLIVADEEVHSKKKTTNKSNS